MYMYACIYTYIYICKLRTTLADVERRLKMFLCSQLLSSLHSWLGNLQPPSTHRIVRPYYGRLFSLPVVVSSSWNPLLEGDPLLGLGRQQPGSYHVNHSSPTLMSKRCGQLRIGCGASAEQTVMKKLCRLRQSAHGTMPNVGGEPEAPLDN